MHDFARDVNLPPEEWLKTIGFLRSALGNLLHDKTAVELETEGSLTARFTSRRLSPRDNDLHATVNSIPAIRYDFRLSTPT
jgi:hypothetical protein